MKNMKALKKISLIFVLFFLYTFVLSRNYLPETIAVKGEEIRISDIEVIPVGEVIGIKLYTSGVLVVGTAKIDGADGNSYKPYENTDIKEGDSIFQVAGEYVNSTEELINIVNRNGENPISINYIRNNNENVAEITPVKDQQGYYKLGLWVRDSAAGVGTMTFYNEQTQTFAALGHPITDIDTGDIIQTSSGEIAGTVRGILLLRTPVRSRGPPSALNLFPRTGKFIFQKNAVSLLTFQQNRI